MPLSSCFFNFLLFTILHTTRCFHERGYIITSPSVFRAELDHVISVRIFNHAEPVRVNVKLVDLRENLIASVSSEVISSGTLRIKVPSGHQGKANLKACGNCYLNTGFQFFNTTAVTIVNKGASAFLQTDKPIYKPSQTVFVNVFSVNRDLKPINDNISAYVMAPNDVRMIQWKSLKPECCGVVNISFPLSDQPVLGTWTIFAEVQQRTYNTSFEIQKYVLPKFDIAINPPPYFRSECEDITVEANYVFGKPVVGSMEVNMTVHGSDYSRSRYLDIGTPIVRSMQINRQARISVCLNDLLPDGLNAHFRGFLHIFARVTAEDGGEFVAFDDTTPVSRENVDIEFTSDTREYFKPGIPFDGKISSKYLDGSSASHVSVILDVSVDGANFFSQELTSNSNGILAFVIPELPSSCRLVWIEARVLAISGELVGEHSLSIYRRLRSWYSPTNCHILAQAANTPLQVNDHAEISVKSSCPCNFTLFYEILSRGNIVSTGSKVVTSGSGSSSSRRKRSPSSLRESDINELQSIEEVIETEICETSLSLDVTPNMAPSSRILVYYVRENGEGVADSMVLPVKPKLENEVEVMTSEAETSPGSEINVRVTSNPGSCVCLAVVDRSVHLMKPGYMLRQHDIFEEMEDYDLDNSPYEHDNSWRLRSKRNVHTDFSHDAKDAFLEAGLVVMTNVVSLDYKASTQIFTQFLRQAREEARKRHTPPSKLSRRKRSFFPETWMWNCFRMSSEQKNFTVQVPDSITTWQMDAVSLNPTSGIGIAAPESLRSFKQFFLDFNMPYSVVRGEEVQIPLTVYNYLDVCVEARVLVSLPSGISFRRQGNNRLLRSVCVRSQRTETITLNLYFQKLGQMNISASAEAIVGSTSCCNPRSDERRSIVSSDSIRRNCLVEAEGVRREYTHSVFFCPNERINISTPSGYTFQFVQLPNNDTTGFDFLVKAEGNVHIVLAEERQISSGVYEIVLGGSNNQKSWISKNSQRLVTAATDMILSEEAYKPFWITWTDGNIQVGTGSNRESESRFMQWRQPRDTVSTVVNYVGFATSEEASGDFRLWQREATDEWFRQIFSLHLDANAVPHSSRATASLIGDVMGPTLKNLQNLLNLPFGCGEQNLANFAPNIYVLKYLQGTKQLTEEIKQKTLLYLQTGYQRQLTYKRSDGSYSAFGEKDLSGSMWLTAFVLKCFSQARGFIYIDPNQIHGAKEWIVSRQGNNGAFHPVGRIWNKDIQSGVDSEVALTAFVTIALAEAGLDHEEEEIAVIKAKEYLESRVEDNTDPYTASLTAYALTLLESDFADAAQSRLYDKAITGATYTYWSLNELALPEDAEFGYADSMKQTVKSAEVELTAYALLTYIHDHDHSVTLPIVKWLSKKRNTIGGFSSTQDTCVALQALSEYAEFSFIGGVSLHVHLATSNYDKNFVLNNENNKVMQTAVVPSLPSDMFVEATGVGCALLQIDVSYNIPKPNENETDFFIKVDQRVLAEELNSNTQRNQSEDVNVVSLTSAERDVRYELEACTRWLHHGSSNMAVMEVNLLTGYEPDLESLERLLYENQLNLKRYDVSGQKIEFYFDEVQGTCKTCIRFILVKNFEAARKQPRPVKIYDYYEPEFLSEILYSDETTEDVETPSSADAANQKDNYGECSCTHDCWFEGPPVCGSNSVNYINRCRMNAAACELGISIEKRDKSFCEVMPVEEPAPSSDDEVPINVDDEDVSDSEETFQYFTEEDYYALSFPSDAEDVIHPPLQTPDNSPEP